MALIDLYATRGTNTGQVSGPSSVATAATTTQAMLNFNSNLNRDNAGALGTTYTDTITAIQAAGTATNADPLVANANTNHSLNPTRYLTGIFNQINTRTNGLVSRTISSLASGLTTTGNLATRTNLGAGNFPTDIVPYTERAFSQAAINSGQATADTYSPVAAQGATLASMPSVTQIASQTVPILTSTQQSTTPLIPGMSTAGVDTRYDITVGYGYVLYDTRGTYQS